MRKEQINKDKGPSIEQLRKSSGYDTAKVKNLYSEWDKTARKKDFDECERIEGQIKKIHDKHGIEET